MQPKKTQRQTHGPTGLRELFLLTVPIEEVARCQYKTVLIIFPLNLQTITITLDVVKWRWGGAHSLSIHLFFNYHRTCNSIHVILYYKKKLSDARQEFCLKHMPCDVSAQLSYLTILYRKNCIQSIQCCISRRSKKAKINVINDKHEYMR